MEKKEFLRRDSEREFFDKLKITELPDVGGGGASKVPGLSRKAFAIVRFILGICLMPFVYAFTLSFLNSLSLIAAAAQVYFWAGVISFLIVYLFVAEPAKVYLQGQKLLEIVFHFFAPLVKVAPYLLPIYTVLVFFIYLLVALFNKSNDVVNYFMYSCGFTFILHLVFSAKTLRAKQDYFKASYIFGFSLAYLINLALVGLLLNLVFENFSFVHFFNNGSHAAGQILKALFTQLFGVK
jgi:hypothetical protein